MSVAFDPAPPRPGEAPALPPLLTGVRVDAAVDPMTKAIAAAASGVDAGTLFWADREDRLDAAIVFAPETPLRQALPIFYAAAVGLGDALGALAPPEVAVTWVWPDRVRVNGADAGALRLAAATDDAKAEPDWLVVAVTLQIDSLDQVHGCEPGRRPDVTSLRDEGCAELSRTRLLESWSRHLLVWTNRLLDDGFRPVHDAWRIRAERLGEPVTLSHQGRLRRGAFLGLDEDGAMLLRDAEGTEALSLSGALAAPRSWPPAAPIDPAPGPSGAPTGEAR